MDRREAIKRVGLLMGGVVSMSAISGVLGGCRVGPATAPFVPQTLDAAQNDLVVTLTELIIPETDTPGAQAARVNEFVDRMLTDWYAARERDHFLNGLADVDARAQTAHGKAFVALTPEEQTALLTTLEDESLAYHERRQDEAEFDEFGRRVDGAAEAEPEAPPFFSMIKELTLLGYYTSEIGATQELKEMPFGAYDGSVPFDQIGRAWS